MNCNSNDFQLNRQRQRDALRAAEEARLVREAQQADGSKYNAALANLGRMLENVGERLQEQYGAPAEQRRKWAPES